MLFIYSILFYIFSSILFTNIGYSLFCKIKNNSIVNTNKYLSISFSFFLGSSITIIILFILQILFGLFYSILIIYILYLIIFIYNKNKIKYNHYDLLLITIIIITQTTLALIPMNLGLFNNLNLINPFYGYGSIVHSFRAANLSIYIYNNNSIPFINQNIGQSFFAAIPAFFKINCYQVNLVIWKSITLFFIFKLIYGMISIFSNTNKKLIYTILYFFIQTALSLTYVQTTDTGSSLIFCHNTDTLFSIVLLFFLLFFTLYCNLKDNYFIFIFLLASNFFGAQNILIFIAVISYLSIRHLYTYNYKIIIYIILSLFFGYKLTGLFCINYDDLSSNIPGLLSVIDSKYEFISFRYPIFSNIPHFEYYLKPNYIRINNLFYQNTVLKFIFILISSFLAIILGILSFIYFLKLKSISGKIKHIIIVLILLGLISNSMINIYGKSWEMSRFYYFTNYVLNFLIILPLFFKESNFILKHIIVFFSILPVVLFFSYNIYSNLDSFSNVKERFEYFINNNYIIGKDFKLNN